jgi:energy-coupling factor transport system substrate-specific component
MTIEYSMPGVATSSWRTRDIVVAATIGVAFAVVFWFWNVTVWPAATALFAFFPPAQNIVYGVWLIPAVLAPLVIRRPGAAIFAELVAAVISALLGNQWGVDTILSGFVQGAAAELVFAMTLYRNWSVPVVVAAAVASAAAAWIHDWVIYYQALALDQVVWIGVFMAVSAIVVTAGGSILLARALRRAGVLEGFPA